MSLLIRRAAAEDAPESCRVVRESIEELCVQDHKGDTATLSAWLANKTLKNFEFWIQSSELVSIVAELEGRIVGFGLLNLDGTIALLYVSPAARFTGVSKAILNAIEQEAVAAGLSELCLESTATALPFYMSAGYRRNSGCAPGFGVSSCYPMSRRLRDE